MLPYRENLDGRVSAGQMTVTLNYRHTAGNMVSEHWHPCLELLYVFGGQAQQTLSNSNFTLKSGDTLLICGGAVHATRALEDDSYIGVAMFYHTAPIPSLYLPAGQCSQMERLFSQMQEEYTLAKPGYQFVVQGLLFQVLGLLERYGTQMQSFAASEGEGQRLEEYIRTHLSAGVSLQDVAAFAGYSPSYLSRRFPELMGMPFKSYVDQMKIQAAKGLLCDGIRVNEIAEALCYDTPSSFCRAFKRITGCTPSEYQNLEGQKMDSLR
ncbi:MAG: helix-turn-helix domain-containing protein [Massiliimalia sp.]